MAGSLRIALIEPPVVEPRRPSLALACLAAALRRDGHDVAIHDLNAELHHRASPDDRALWGQDAHWASETAEGAERFLAGHEADIAELLQNIADGAPDLVGLSMLIPQRRQSIALARRLRTLCPDATIVFGGADCFPMFLGDCFEGEGVPDHVVTGEGEDTICELAARLAAGEDPLCPGVEQVQPWRSGGPRAEIADLDALPVPDWHGFPLHRYTQPGRFSVMATRGCVNHCAFCMEPELWPAFRMRSPEGVAAEIAGLRDGYGASEFEFVDSTLNGAPRWLMAVCDAIVDRELELVWGAQATVNRVLDDEGCKKLHAAGCRCLTFGIESGSDLVLQRMGKRFTAAQAGAALRACHAAGIDTAVNVMVGFPGEGEAEFEQTLEFLSANREAIRWANPADGFTGVIPGTRLHRDHEQFGMRLVGDLRFWESADGENNYPVRLARFERLLRRVHELGLECSYPGVEYRDREAWLQRYEDNRRRYGSARP